jgi:hypothetical protein
MSTKQRLAAEVVADHAAVQQAVQAAESLYGALVQDLDQTLAQTVRRLDQEHSQAVQRATTDLDRARQSVRTAVQAATAASGYLAAPWTAQGWLTHTPPTAGGPPRLLRLGELRPTGSGPPLPPLPALLPVLGERHVLISFEDTQSRQGAGILESLAWRIAALSPPGTYRLVLIDPLDRGANLASLLKLPDEIRGPKIYCADDEIERALQQVAQDIEEVIQRRLLNTYRDSEAYNAAHPDVAVPYRFLVLVGFPRGFSPKAAELLANIARTGRRAGCYILGGLLRGSSLPHGFDFAPVMKQATYVTLKTPNQVEWNDPDFAQLPVRPDDPPPAEVIDHLARTVQTVVVKSAAARTTIPFTRVAMRKAQWWQGSSAGGLEVPVGINEAGGVQTVGLGRGVTHHALVGGATGTGKTNLLHLLVLQLSITYAPDELELYLVDFKEGVEFQDYVTYRLPHARAVVLEAEREFGLSILQRLVQEMEQRSRLFKAARVNDLPEYRKQTGQQLPRTLLIMDEYVVLFGEDDRLSYQAAEALAALVMRGRSFGIHVLLSAQRPASTFLSMSQIKSQMGLRIALKCRPEDSSLILGEGNERAARLTQVGEACLTTDPDRIDATIQARIAYLTSDDRALYLRGLQEFTRLRHYVPVHVPIVFSRDVPADWRAGPGVAARLAAPTWTPLPVPLCWLGQPLRIADDLTLTWEPQPQANLALVGGNEPLAWRLLVSTLLGLSLTTAPTQARFVLIGAFDPQQPAGMVLGMIREGIPHPLACHARREAVDALTLLVGELDSRLAQLPAWTGDTVFVLIAGLHRWLEVRGPNAYTPSVAGEHLIRLCQQGPQVGIHTLLWTDRLSTISAAVGGAAQHELLGHFAHRVALQTNADESMAFLGVAYAARLGSERAYYRNEQWPADMVDKFKPYALPAPDQLSTDLATIRARWA